MKPRTFRHTAGTTAIVGLLAAATFAAQPVPVSPVPAGPPEATSAPATPAVPPLWVAVAASGRVHRRDAGAAPDAWLKLRRGDSIAPLAHVRAEDRGRATLTRNGDIILVSPGSQVTLPEGAGAVDTIRQNGGRALYQVKPGRAGRFEVVTPLLVAGVKGTQFSVIVRDGFAAVEVVEGHVEVQSLLDADDRWDLFAGDIVTIDEKQRRSEVFHEDREEVHAIDTSRTRLEQEVRDDTERLGRVLLTEKSMFDFEALWKQRMVDQWGGKNEALRKESEFRTFDDKVTSLEEDTTRKELLGGTVNNPLKP